MVISVVSCLSDDPVSVKDFFCIRIRGLSRSTYCISSAASDVYKGHVMDIAFENEQIPRYNVYRCPDCDTLLYVRSDFPVLRPREKGANKK